MPFISHISVRGLFHLYDHDIELRQKPRLTIVAGPNGVGKTTLLGLTQALLNGHLRKLAKYEFEQLVVAFQDGREISAAPILNDHPAEDAGMQLRLALRSQGRRLEEAVVDVPSAHAELGLPAYVEQRDAETFFDRQMGEFLSLDEAQFRYGRQRGQSRAIAEPLNRWRQEYGWSVDFIETKRLDTLIVTEARHRHPRRREGETAPIYTYLRAVRQALDSARGESTKIRQRRDRNFVRRLLDTKASRATVNELDLRERYSKIEREAEMLARNGLLTDSLDVIPNAGLNPTEKRVIKLFLDDFETKLKPLRPISSKVEHLRATINSKFLNKELELDPADGVQFRANPGGQRIAPDALSSGEQHELALISRLLFTEGRGTTVLIDEPELSLHVSWQHEMVEDLIQIGKLAEISFVLATHSTAIINGRWDLVDELGPLDASRSV